MSACYSPVDEPNQSDYSDSSQPNKRRSSRACDLCRRTKNKCRRPIDLSKPCSSCAAAGKRCTYEGPSYKRGPPKGYIHAIEKRLNQMEAVLGAIVSSKDSKSQDVVAVLSSDELAKKILGRVNSGPYGPINRSLREAGATRTDFLSTISRPPNTRGVRNARVSRESRVTREIVSSAQEELPNPTPDWQKGLIVALEHGSGRVGPPEPPDLRSELAERNLHIQTDFDGLYTMDAYSHNDCDSDGVFDDVTAVDPFILKNNHCIQLEGADRSPLSDSFATLDDARDIGEIWHLPLATPRPDVLKESEELLDSPEDHTEVQMPSGQHQDILVGIYFAYIHPDLPVLHKQTFLNGYTARKRSQNADFAPSPDDPARNVPKLSKLLLLTVFAVASQIDCEYDGLWKADDSFLTSVRYMLYSSLQRPSLSICQALIILAYREFGIGSIDQSWLYAGMAVRIAQELALDHNDNSSHCSGGDILEVSQKQERIQVWWACAIIEKNISSALGRPSGMRGHNYKFEFPHDFEAEEAEEWRSHPTGSSQARLCPSMTGHALSCFKAQASLSEIVGEIIDKLYAVRQDAGPENDRLLTDFTGRLEDWIASLPTYLQYDTTIKRHIPPHILNLHTRYWFAIIFLNRKFALPEIESISLKHCSRAMTKTPLVLDSNLYSLGTTRTETRFGICRIAATKITEIAQIYRELFGLRSISAFMPSYLMAAGIVHLVDLAMHVDSASAVTKLEVTLDCMKGVEKVWPSAAWGWELLNAARVKFHNAAFPIKQNSRNPEMHGVGSTRPGQVTTRPSNTDDYRVIADSSVHQSNGLASRMMADMLGLKIPGVPPEVSANTELDGRSLVANVSFGNGMGTSADAMNRPSGFLPSPQSGASASAAAIDVQNISSHAPGEYENLTQPTSVLQGFNFLDLLVAE